ncbi:hypothetical protein TSOC_015369, partial [Tetrabaena socialis]
IGWTTALILAIGHFEHGHTGPTVEVVEALLAAGADTEDAMDCGWTALYLASTYGETAVVKALLAAGADTEAKGE